jgi:hypothetical protein
VLRRAPGTIPFSTEALKANLLRLQNEWETVQASRDRDAIYQYLSAVFELVTWWDREGKAGKRANRAPTPARVFFGEGGRTVCRCDSLHGRSRQGR